VDKAKLILETADGFEIEDEEAFSIYVSNTNTPAFLVKEICETAEQTVLTSNLENIDTNINANSPLDVPEIQQVYFFHFA
jgi:hypothetical protein